MRPTEGIHPGGVPSQSHRPDEVPQHGAVNFYRQVLKPREHSQTEEAVGTKENSSAPEKDETDEEVVEGYLYEWASNICHLEDTKVKVEDLSDRDIDPGLAQNTQEILSKILKCDAEGMQAYSSSKQREGSITEEFTTTSPLGNWRVYRKTYYDIDAREGPNLQYPTSAIAKRILAESETKVGPPPSGAQVELIACRILAEDRGDLRDKNKAIRWAKLLSMAYEELYKHRGDATFQSSLKDELSNATKRPASLTDELVELVEKNLRKGRKAKNKFHQFQIDGEAFELCERVEGFDIVMLRDRKCELICGVVTEAVQKLFPAETVDQMSTAAEAFAWRFPYKKPDILRHPTSQQVHLVANPDKDVHSKECKQPHFAVCGVEHYGLHHETGHSSGFNGFRFQKFSLPPSRNDKLLGSNAWKEEFPKLKGGVYGAAAKVSRHVLKALDPKLYDDYMEVRQHLPDSLKLTLATTGENPYGYMAQLVDTLTEGHTDVTDWVKGMAALTCFGNFTGGDLVLKELGVRIAFPSGSNCHLRGQGLHHMISSYEGIRHCLVLTNKESVRKTISMLDKRLEEETDRAAKLISKDPQDWTDEEHKLKEAYNEGENTMLEYTWELIKRQQDPEGEQKQKESAKHKAEDSKADHAEGPPKKKGKKTKTKQ